MSAGSSGPTAPAGRVDRFRSWIGELRTAQSQLDNFALRIEWIAQSHAEEERYAAAARRQLREMVDRIEEILDADSVADVEDPAAGSDPGPGAGG